MRKVLALSVAMCLLLTSVSGCELPIGVGSKVSEEDVLDVADSFLDAVLEVNGKKVLKQVVEDDQDSEYFENEDIFQDDLFGASILEEAEYEADEDSVEFKKNNKNCEVEYTITMPAFDDVLDGYYESFDIEDAIKAADDEEITVTIELECEDDEWLVANFEEVCDDIYGDMFMLFEGEVVVEPVETEKSTSETTGGDDVVVETEGSDESEDEVTVPTEMRDFSKKEYTEEEVKNAAWTEGVLYFNDTVVVLPADFSDFLKDWMIVGDDVDENYILNPGDSTFVFLEMIGASYTHLSVRVANWNSDGPIALKDAQVTLIDYFQSSDGVDLSDSYLPGGVTFGMTPEEVMAIYGTPDEYYEAEDADYIAIDYRCYPTIVLTVSFTSKTGMNEFYYGYYNDSPIADS